MPAWSATDHSPFDSLERLLSSHVEALVDSERNETSTKTGQEDDPTSFKRVGITNKRTLSLIPHIGSGTDGKALSPSSLPEHFCCSNGKQEGRQSDIPSLESPSADVGGRRRRLRSARLEAQVVDQPLTT